MIDALVVGLSYRALSVATVVTLPLVSVPLLPATAATAVTPVSVVFATLLVVGHTLLGARSLHLPRWLIIGGLVTAMAVVASYLPVIVDLSAYGVDPSQAVSRALRAIATLLASGVYVAAFFVMVRSTHVGTERLIRIAMAAAAIHAVVALLALATVIGVPGLSDVYRVLREALTTSGANPIGGLRRVAALSFEPSFAGFEYVGWWLPITVAMAFTVRMRWIGIGLTAVFGTAAAATFSLTAALGLAIVASVAGTIHAGTLRGALRRAMFVFGAVVALSVLLVLPPVVSVLDRIGQQLPLIVSGEFAERGPRDPSLAVRGALLHTGVDVAVAHPATGAGFGLAGYRFSEHRPAWTFVNPYMAEYVRYLEDPDGRVFPSAKNLYVRAWSEAGPLLVLTLLALIVLAFRRSVALVRRGPRDDAHRWLGLAAALGIAGSAAAYLSLDSFAIPYLWAWLGIVAGMRYP